MLTIHSNSHFEIHAQTFFHSFSSAASYPSCTTAWCARFKLWLTLMGGISNSQVTRRTPCRSRLDILSDCISPHTCLSGKTISAQHVLSQQGNPLKRNPKSGLELRWHMLLALVAEPVVTIGFLRHKLLSRPCLNLTYNMMINFFPLYQNSLTSI